MFFERVDELPEISSDHTAADLFCRPEQKAVSVLDIIRAFRKGKVLHMAATPACLFLKPVFVCEGFNMWALAAAAFLIEWDGVKEEMFDDGEGLLGYSTSGEPHKGGLCLERLSSTIMCVILGSLM